MYPVAEDSKHVCVLVLDIRTTVPSRSLIKYASTGGLLPSGCELQWWVCVTWALIRWVCLNPFWSLWNLPAPPPFFPDTDRHTRTHTYTHTWTCARAHLLISEPIRSPSCQNPAFSFVQYFKVFAFVLILFKWMILFFIFTLAEKVGSWIQWHTRFCLSEKNESGEKIKVAAPAAICFWWQSVLRSVFGTLVLKRSPVGAISIESSSSSTSTTLLQAPSSLHHPLAVWLVATSAAKYRQGHVVCLYLNFFLTLFSSFIPFIRSLCCKHPSVP